MIQVFHEVMARPSRSQWPSSLGAPHTP
jgi:hypothetical protein